MGNPLKSLLKVALPVLGTFLAPGIGTALGSTLSAGSIGALGGAIGGGLGGAISGDGLKGVGLGALGGAAFGGAPSIAAEAGLGAGGTSALSGAIKGASLGGIGGGAEGALTGAALGGLGGYLTSGASVPGLGNASGATLDQVSGIQGMQGPTQGSGLLGSFTEVSGGAQPMKLGSLLQKGGDVFSYYQGDSDIEKMRRLMEEQAANAQSQLTPYSQAGQTALANMQAPSLEALQSDPGYQFRLQQGQQALDRSLAARGMSQSGAALKAVQDYGQGIADQTYNDYYNRQAGIANMGYGAAGGLGSIYTGLGNAQAAAIRSQIENRNKLYSSLGGLFNPNQNIFY